MAGEWFDVANIKVALKKAKSNPVPFAFGMGSSLSEGQLAMHAKRSPDFLGRALKKEGFKSNRILMGTAQVDGSVLIVTVEKVVSKAKVSIKHFLKVNPLPNLKVEVIGPGGGVEEEEEDKPDEAEEEPEKEEEEKSGDWFNTGMIKVALKKAKSIPVPMAFGMGSSLDEGQLAMHAKRSPEFLGRMLKKAGFKSNRILMGTAQVNAGVLIVTTEKVVSKAKVSIKHFLKVNPLPKLKVQLMGPGGEVDVEDDEDEQDLAGAAPESPGEDKTAFLRRLAGLTPQIKKALAGQGADAKLLGAKFKKAHTLGKNGDYGPAMLLFDELDEQLKVKPKATGQPDNPLGAEWNKRLKTLTPQIKEILSAKLEGSRDIALKFKDAQGFGSKQEFESGIAMLNEVSSMIEALKSASDKQKSEWTKRFKTLQADLVSVLKQGLGDQSKLRAASEMAIEKAGSGDYVTALKILDRLQPAVLQALSSAKPSVEEGRAGDERGSGDTRAQTTDAETATAPEGFTEYAKMFGVIEKSYQQLIKTIPEGQVKDELRKQMNWVNAQAEKEDYKAAIAALDKLESLIADAPARVAEEATRKKADNVFTFPYRKALLQYAMAKDSVNSALRGFVSDTKAQLPEQASIASTMQELISELNDELYDEVDEALDSDAVNASEYYKSVKKVIDEYRRLIRGNDIIKHLDKPPVALGIGNTLISALDKLDKTIAA